MAIISWSDEYSVGVKDMDEQHKKLIGMINELNEAMKSGKGKDIMEKILKNLVDYTVTHFSSEEKLMQSNAYPGYLAQKSQHEALTKQVSDFQTKYHEGKAVLSVEIMTFLKDWLMNHIKGSDKKYGPFLNKKGIS